MADPRNGKGGFKAFAQHEHETANTALPLGALQGVKPAPIVGMPPATPDVAPAAKAGNSLPTTPGGTKPTARH
ncbi:MAG: hypothetical protein JWN53_1158 [Gemmatimonadetes bacterium]|nr:hypothetical protein [Gemmatimonadota bacterium]